MKKRALTLLVILSISLTLLACKEDKNDYKEIENQEEIEEIEENIQA